MRPGKTYVLRNESLKELLVEVGTERTAAERAAKLGKGSGVPGRFHVEEEVIDVGYAEQLAHGRLAAYRFQANREFFQLPYDLAIRAVIDTCKEVNKYNALVRSLGHLSTWARKPMQGECARC